jgi:hypothetical protein
VFTLAWIVITEMWVSRTSIEVVTTGDGMAGTDTTGGGITAGATAGATGAMGGITPPLAVITTQDLITGPRTGDRTMGTPAGITAAVIGTIAGMSTGSTITDALTCNGLPVGTPGALLPNP